MNTELTELVFILDRSGSMGGLESDTIGGFNSMIARQKKEKSRINVTTILFDDEVDMIHDRFPIDMVEPLTEKEYFVRGCTALFDAVGIGIEKLDRVQRHLPEKYRAGKVIFVITTDGLENSSTHYTQSQIRKMIEAKKECGWEFSSANLLTPGMISTGRSSSAALPSILDIVLSPYAFMLITA